ncbi:MAG: DUF938 domain-containing protein, partial [Pseudomonadota bacterium]
MPASLPVHPSVARNRGPLVSVLATVLNADSQVMEVGAGTGEHARFFLRHLQFKCWTSTDVAERLPEIIARQKESLGSRLNVAKAYRAGVTDWPCRKID